MEDDLCEQIMEEVDRDTTPPAEEEGKATVNLSTRDLRVRLLQTNIMRQNLEVSTKSAVKPRPRTAMLNWLTTNTTEKVEANIKGEGERKQCKLCRDSGFFSKRRIRIHIRQHLCLMYCKCGFHHPSRDVVYCHQRRLDRTEEHGGADGPVYSVDKDSYTDFCAHMEWKEPAPYGSLNGMLPTLDDGVQVRAVLAEPTVVRRPRIHSRVATKEMVDPPRPQTTEGEPMVLRRPGTTEGEPMVL